MKKTIFKFIGVVLCATAMTAAAYAVAIPSKSVVNPLTETIYAPNNGAAPAQVLVYRRTEDPIKGWTNTGTVLTMPSTTAKIFGMAVSADGTKLFVSINNAQLSKLRVYNLDSQGIPDGTYTLAVWTPATYDSPAGVAVMENRAYVADMGSSQIRYFDYDGANWNLAGSITEGLTGITNIYDVAIGPVQKGAGSVSYPIFVTRKANSSTTKELFMYQYNGTTGSDGTITLVASLDLQFPTYMQVVGNQLYVAVNGTDGDIKVFDFSGGTLTPVATVSSDISGAFGWAGMAVNPAATALYYTQAQTSNESSTKLYKVTLPVTTDTAATIVASISKADGAIVAPDGAALAATYSGSGFLQNFDNSTDSDIDFLVPVFESIRPTSTTYGGTAVDVAITGKNFVNAPNVQTQPFLYSSNAYKMDNIVIDSSTHLHATIDTTVSDGARNYGVYIKNADLTTPGNSKTSATSFDAFTINFTPPANVRGSASNDLGQPLNGGQLRWTWNLNNQGESHYDVLDQNGAVVSTVSAPSQSATETGLGVNQQYTRKVRVRYFTSPSAESAPVTAYSAAATPAIAAITAEATPSVSLTIDPKNNPAGTNFEVWRKTATAPYTLVGTTAATTYDDTTVDFSTGYTYKVRALNGDNQPSNFSDEETVNSSSGIVVTTPVTGKLWFRGKTFTISWESSASVQNVKIELSTDNGISFSPIINSTPNTNKYVWSIPDTTPLSDFCQIKVTDTANPARSGKSGIFLIREDNTPPNLVSLSPADGATNVANNVTISATFNEEYGLNPAFVNDSNISIEGYGVTNINMLQSGTDLSMNSVISFQADRPLTNGAVIKVHLKGGANGIQDWATNPISTTEVVWSFTVGSGAGAPTVTNVYPRRTPTTAAANIRIIGTNFTGATAVKLETSPATALNYAVDSATQISATVPSGIVVGTYHITVANASGTSSQTPSDTFEVTTSTDPTASQVTDLTAAAGDKQVGLSWTNPNDNDMGTIEVRRYTGGFPAAHDGSGTAILTDVPTPGASVAITDSGLVNGTTYYYVVFIQDTSGNWSVVDSTAPGVNAASATPAADPIATITISREGDTVNSPVTITWTTNPAGIGVDIYSLTCTTDASGNYIDYFTTDASKWTKIATNVIISTYTIQNKVGNGTAEYYKLIATGTTLNDINLTANVVGKFDLAIGVEPEKFFVSLPLAPNASDLAAIFGGQAVSLDTVFIFDAQANPTAASTFNGTTWGEFAPGIAQVTSINQGYSYGYATTVTRYVTTVGKVLNSASNTRPIEGGAVANWAATAYPTVVSIQNAGLENSSIGASALDSGTIYHFDSNANLLDGNSGMSVHTGSGQWSDLGMAINTTVLQPGKGYMFTEPNAAITWTQPRSY